MMDANNKPFDHEIFADQSSVAVEVEPQLATTSRRKKRVLKSYRNFDMIDKIINKEFPVTLQKFSDEHRKTLPYWGHQLLDALKLQTTDAPFVSGKYSPVVKNKECLEAQKGKDKTLSHIPYKLQPNPRPGPKVQSMPRSDISNFQNFVENEPAEDLDMNISNSNTTNDINVSYTRAEFIRASYRSCIVQRVINICGEGAVTVDALAGNNKLRVNSITKAVYVPRCYDLVPLADYTEPYHHVVPLPPPSSLQALKTEPVPVLAPAPAVEPPTAAAAAAGGGADSKLANPSGGGSATTTTTEVSIASSGASMGGGSSSPSNTTSSNKDQGRGGARVPEVETTAAGTSSDITATSASIQTTTTTEAAAAAAAAAQSTATVATTTSDSHSNTIATETLPDAAPIVPPRRSIRLKLLLLNEDDWIRKTRVAKGIYVIDIFIAPTNGLSKRKRLRGGDVNLNNLRNSSSNSSSGGGDSSAKIGSTPLQMRMDPMMTMLNQNTGIYPLSVVTAPINAAGYPNQPIHFDYNNYLHMHNLVTQFPSATTGHDGGNGSGSSSSSSSSSILSDTAYLSYIYPNTVYAMVAGNTIHSGTASNGGGSGGASNTLSTVQHPPPQFLSHLPLPGAAATGAAATATATATNASAAAAAAAAASAAVDGSAASSVDTRNISSAAMNAFAAAGVSAPIINNPTKLSTKRDASAAGVGGGVVVGAAAAAAAAGKTKPKATNRNSAAYKAILKKRNSSNSNSGGTIDEDVAAANILLNLT